MMSRESTGQDRSTRSTSLIAACGFAPGALWRAAFRSPILAHVVLLLASLTFLGGCEQQSPAGMDAVKMQIGNRTFVLEVARTQAQQEKGLMKRDALPAGHGMIFPMPEQRVQGFWMQNVRFPLDIIFADNQGKVVSIHTMDAYDETTTYSDKPARYAIELNKGDAKQAAVQVGDILNIPPAARAKD
jgi:uncharacterized protein